MVKVLENSLVDLDIIPGKEEQELQAQAGKQAQALKGHLFIFGNERVSVGLKRKLSRW